jgi:hypothetical protein
MSWLAGVSVALLVGCATRTETPASRPPAPPGSSASTVKEGQATLYVFNISGWTLIPSNQDIIDNGKLLVSLPRLTYAKVPIRAGAHDLRLHGRQLVLTADAGSTHYVAAGYRPERSAVLPLAGDPVFIKQISEEEARRLREELKLQEIR